ncbi:MAG: 5-dehydro-2-deoxygluconokinase [Rhodospirillales bacterium]|nr:5-dehydro-2-deoxygluconokinase [Rhodospirillales bacterium]
MEQLIERLRQGRFISVGRAGIDFYPEPPGTKIEDGTHFSAHIGGSAGNIAVALAKQGCRVELVSCVSDDAIGRFTTKTLEKFGVGTAYCRIVGGEARNTLAVAETRVENYQVVIYRNGAADFEMNVDDVQSLDYENTSAIILSGTSLAAEPSRAAVFRAIELARRAGTATVIDMDYRPYSWTSQQEAAEVYSRAISQCDIVIGNDVEFDVAAGNTGGSPQQGLDFARSLVSGLPSIIVYKMGEFGSITFTQSGASKNGIYRVDALKPTGAGDGFLGGFIAGLSRRLGIDDAVRYGSASAALVVTRVACSSAMPTPEEIDVFTQSHSIEPFSLGENHAYSSI